MRKGRWRGNLSKSTIGSWEVDKGRGRKVGISSRYVGKWRKVEGEWKKVNSS